VEVSYMEIYNEKVHDLLDLTSNGKIGLKVRFPILKIFIVCSGFVALWSYNRSELLFLSK
jgi:hypothetical protein